MFRPSGLTGALLGLMMVRVVAGGDISHAVCHTSRLESMSLACGERPFSSQGFRTLLEISVLS